MDIILLLLIVSPVIGVIVLRLVFSGFKDKSGKTIKAEKNKAKTNESFSVKIMKNPIVWFLGVILAVWCINLQNEISDDSIIGLNLSGDKVYSNIMHELIPSELDNGWGDGMSACTSIAIELERCQSLSQEIEKNIKNGDEITCRVNVRKLYDSITSCNEYLNEQLKYEKFSDHNLSVIKKYITAFSDRCNRYKRKYGMATY